MKKLIFLSIILSASTACAVLKPRDIIRACAAEQIDLCGDLICEGDQEFETVIAGSAMAITNCFEDTQSIGSEYFNPVRQKEIFKSYGVEEYFK